MPKGQADPLARKERITALSEEDRLRVRFALQHGEPVEIMVQYEALIGGKWTQVRRYDTKHGFFHVHQMPWDKRRDKRRRLDGGLKEALTMAIKDLQENWPRYREACEADKAATSVGEER
jgi:hypothetical protein